MHESFANKDEGKVEESRRNFLEVIRNTPKGILKTILLGLGLVLSEQAIDGLLNQAFADEKNKKRPLPTVVRNTPAPNKNIELAKPKPRKNAPAEQRPSLSKKYLPGKVDDQKKN